VSVVYGKGNLVLGGVESTDHVRIHIEYPPRTAISRLMKRLKGRSSKLLQQEFAKLRERYWGRHFWATGYGAWSTGNITDEMVQAYLEHHRSKGDDDDSDFILEEDFSPSLPPPVLSVQGGLVNLRATVCMMYADADSLKPEFD